MSNVHAVQSRGIYHGLPVYPESINGLTAIITGANGISGYHMLKVLGQDARRWSKIYCLSRRPPAIPGGLPKQAEHIPLDFLKDPDEIATTLQDNGVEADYVFFFSYIQVPPMEGKGLWSNAEEMTRVNTLLLTNFLKGLELAKIKPKRFMLQTGAKHYGIHLGPTLIPQSEEDPRVTLEPNFYYPQEDALFDWCKKNSVGWNVVRPSFILGAVPDAAMNMVQGLGVYAAVQQHLGKTLEFPASLEAWELVYTQSSATLNAYLEQWSVLSSNTENQAFNAGDDSAFTWARCWPKLAKWYGVEYKRPSLNESEYQESETGYDPPPRGFGPRGKVKVRFTLTEWAKQEEVQKAWHELAEKHGLTLKEMPDPERVMAFTDGALLGVAVISFDLNKGKKLGWHGFVDSSECILEVLNDFVALKMLPPVPHPHYQ